MNVTIKITDEDCPKWWTNFIYSFNDSIQFQNECLKLGIKFVQCKEGGKYELHFPDEKTLTMLVLRWS
jgi:hypothetical protein